MTWIVSLFLLVCVSAIASAADISTTPSGNKTDKTGHGPTSKPVSSRVDKTTTPAKATSTSKTTTTLKVTTTSKATTTLPPTTTLSTTPVPKLNCSAKTNCGECAKDYHCYWCGPAKQCLAYPSNRIIPKGCPKNDWYWKQCFIPGYILIIVVPVIAGLFLLTCGCCIYCKCCRTSNRSWKKEEERITARRQERQMRAEERKSERKKTTDALRMKYGLLKSDDEEQLIS